LPGDLAGKSSNTQWAYRQCLQRLAAPLSKYDSSQVFFTCCDADTLLHPQYFSGLTYQALTMPSHERAWSIWQPPILLLRNLFSCPSPTRLSGYGTIFFELAGLANQKVSPHCCYSGYSLSLALASHHFVDGWDRDVIAEDHHMFCKCYFASIWDQLQACSAETNSAGRGLDFSFLDGVTSTTQLRPVFLPAVTYLVESDDGWFASVYDRFVQARRHSQGLSELSYVFLQHMHLLMSPHASRIAMSAHVRILSLAGKMTSVHMIANMHSLAFLMATLSIVITTIRWVLSQDLTELFNAFAARGLEGVLSWENLGAVKWALSAIFGPIPPLGMMMSATTFIVVKDTIEGKLTRDISSTKEVQPTELAAPNIQGSSKGPNGLGLMEKLKLFNLIQSDYFGGALLTMSLYGLIPASLAAWSLLTTKGTGFQYVVGAKPQAG